MSKVQSVLFDRKQWTPAAAERWLASHDFKHNKIDVKEKHLRFRQFNPHSDSYYRIKHLPPSSGIEFVMEFREAAAKKPVKKKKAATDHKKSGQKKRAIKK